MAFSLNRIELIGNLGRDAETRFTTNNLSVTSFSIATTYSYKGKDGNFVNETTWHNCVGFNLSDFYKFHKSHNKFFSMGLFKSPNPSACGIALVNEEGIITDFEEKPPNPRSDLASAGIFLSAPEVLDSIPEKGITDIGFHLIPKLVNKMKGYLVKDYLIDIGTHENLRKAEIDWSSLINNN